jgi:hypothetical protein
MIIEIAVPHILPCLIWVWIALRRLLDRSCTCDKKRSKLMIQSDYEDLYMGPEFCLDYRLAQMIAFVWVTFMFAPGMPILFVISALNFFVMYWVDKFLLTRFYRTPKNFDAEPIDFMLDKFKYCFAFHLVVGFLMLSNERILNSREDLF